MLKSMFARHGISATGMSNNGPQYSSQEFKDFAQEYNFVHVTSSPQSNGQVERGVKTVKKLLKESKDSYLSLLSYHTTRLPWCKLSPAELLIGRAIRSNVPQVEEVFIPKWPYLEKFRQALNGDKSQTLTDLIEPDQLPIYLTILRYGYVRETSRYLVE